MIKRMVAVVLFMLFLPACAKVGDGITRVGGWVKSLDDREQVTVTHERRRVAR